MATESPLTHDGSQTVAAANYGNGASLAGGTSITQFSGQFLCVALSGVTARTSVLASVSGQDIYGILQNKPSQGQAADVGIHGITKAIAGSIAIGVGAPLMTNALGQVIPWTAGLHRIGWALEASAVAGTVITMYVIPSQVHA